MRKILILVGLFCCLSTHIHTQSLADFLGDNEEEICYFAGELVLYGSATAAFAVCMKTGGAACPAAVALMDCAENPGCSWAANTITSSGCTFLITRTEDALRIYGKASKDNVAELQEVYGRLNTVSGMHWLMSYLQ